MTQWMGPIPRASRFQGDIGSLAGSLDDALGYLDKRDAEDSLLSYIRLMWDVLEPGRQFVDGWAVGAICEHLQAVTDGQIRKLLINVPPGCMKSLTTNVFWPSWEWGPRNMPTMRYIGASYSNDLTVRDNRRTRQLIQSERYRAFWGDRFELMGDQNAKVRFDTDARGFKIATSVGGLGTGERGDRFVIDDPHNVKEAESDAKRNEVLMWFSEVVPTRINDPGKSAMIVIMQRVHDADVSGLILRENLGYEHLVLPMEYEPKIRSFTSLKRPDVEPERVTRVQKETDAIPYWLTEEQLAEAKPDDLPAGYEPEWRELYCQDRRAEEGELLWPERFSKDYLDDDLKPALRAWGGSYAEAGQLQQSPVPRGGGLFKIEWFRYLDEEPDGVAWVRGWDLAGTGLKPGQAVARGAKYTVGVRIGLHKGRVVIADVRRGQWSSMKMEQMIRACAEADGHACQISIPQDPGQAGLAQKAHLIKQLHGFKVHFSTESGSKTTRAEPLAAQAEAGNLYLVRGPWNAAFTGELCMFRGGDGELSDQVDGASRGYSRLVRRKGLGVPAAPRFG